MFLVVVLNRVLDGGVATALSVLFIKDAVVVVLEPIVVAFFVRSDVVVVD